VDAAGPFPAATLTGLAAGTTYHYRIGDGGEPHPAAAPPHFTSVDIGDTGTTLCDRGCAQQQLVAAQSPDS